MSDSPERKAPPNVLLVVLDSVRADRLEKPASIDLETPTLDRLMSDGCYYPNAYATGSWTVPAHGSLFTGKLPRQHGAHAHHKYLDIEPGDTIAGKLSAAGYTSIGVSPNPWITPEFGFVTGFDEFHELKPSLPFATTAADPRVALDDPTLGEIARWVLGGNPFKRLVNGLYEKIINEQPYTPAEQVTDQVLERVATVDEPWFAFVNYMDAHEPYGLQRYHVDSAWNLDERALAFDWNLHCYDNPPAPGTEDSVRRFYDMALEYLDRQLGELLAAVDLTTTLLVVVSDHGQSLGESDYWGHGTHLSIPLIDVPFVVSPPESVCFDRDADAVVDLSDVPDLIRETVGIGGEPFSWKSELEIASDAAVAESFGPHQRVNNLPDHISMNGYRAVCTSDVCMFHDIDTGKRRFWEGKPNLKQKSRAIDLDNEVTERISVTHETERREVSMGTRRRLEDLGYL